MAAAQQTIWGTGRRKTSVARVRLLRGTGVITVNDRPLDQYFTTGKARSVVASPLRETKTLAKYDVKASVRGGGYQSQAGAILLGISRALIRLETKEIEKQLRDDGYLTRDSRMTERKKYGRHGARRSVQFSKR